MVFFVLNSSKCSYFMLKNCIFTIYLYKQNNSSMYSSGRSEANLIIIG